MKILKIQQLLIPSNTLNHYESVRNPLNIRKITLCGLSPREDKPYFLNHSLVTSIENESH